MKTLNTNKNTQKAMSTKTLVMYALLTATVIILQALAEGLPKIGPCSLSFTLVPIVIGAALCGPKAGAWLGFVFSCVVLACPSTQYFYNFNIWATIIVVIVKGTLAGYVAGLIYNWLEKYNKTLAICLSAIICPMVNTGIFLIGCFTIFYKYLVVEANGANVIYFIIFGFAFFNFLFELISNIILIPAITRLLNIRKKKIN